MQTTTIIKVESMKVITLVYTGASTSSVQMDWGNKNAIEIHSCKDAYQVCTGMYHGLTINGKLASPENY